MARSKKINTYANNMVRDYTVAKTVSGANKGNLKDYFQAVLGSKEITLGGNGGYVIDGKSGIPSISNSSFEAYKTTDDVINNLVGNGFFHAIVNQDTSTSSMIDRVTALNKSRDINVYYNRINNVQSNVSLDHTMQSLRHYRRMVDQAKNKEVEGYLHVLDTETIGTTSTSSYWNHGYMTEFTAVRHNMAQEYSDQNVTVSANIMRGLDDKTEQALRKEVVTAVRNDPFLMKEENKHLLVTAERAFRYGSSDTKRTLNAKGYYGIDAIGDFQKGTDFSIKENMDRMLAGFKLLNNTYNETAEMTNMSMNAADYAFVSQMVGLQQNLRDGRGILAGYNYKDFDEHVINNTLKQIHSNMRSIYGSATDDVTKSRAQKAIDYIEKNFGKNPAVSTPKGSILDVYNPIKAISSLEGNSAVYNGGPVPTKKALTQEAIAMRFGGKSATDVAHASLTDTVDLMRLMLGKSEALGGENYMDFLYNKMRKATRGSNSKLVKQGQIYELTSALGWATGGRNIMSFTHDIKSGVINLTDATNSSHRINADGTITSMSFSSGAHGKKGSFIKVHGIMEIEPGQEFSAIQQHYHELGASNKLYALKYEVMTPGMVTDAESTTGQIHYFIANSQEKLSSMISNKAKYVGEYKADGGIQLGQEFGSGKQAIQNVQERIANVHNRQEADKFNEKVVNNLYTKYEEIRNRTANIATKKPEVRLAAGVAEQVVSAQGAAILSVNDTIALNSYMINNQLKGGYGNRTLDNMLPQTRKVENQFMSKLDAERDVFNKLFSTLEENASFKGSSRAEKNLMAKEIYDRLALSYAATQTKDYAEAVKMANNVVETRVPASVKQNLMHINLGKYSSNVRMVNAQGASDNFISVDLSAMNRNDFINKIVQKIYGNQELGDKETYYRADAIKTTISQIIKDNGLGQGEYRRYFKNTINILDKSKDFYDDLDIEGLTSEFLTGMRNVKAINPNLLINENQLAGATSYVNHLSLANSKGFNSFVTDKMVKDAVSHVTKNRPYRLEQGVLWTNGKEDYRVKNIINRTVSDNTFNMNAYKKSIAGKYTESEQRDLIRAAEHSLVKYKEMVSGVIRTAGGLDGVRLMYNNGNMSYTHTVDGVTSDAIHVNLPKLVHNQHTGAIEIVQGSSRTVNNAEIYFDENGKMTYSTTFSRAVDDRKIGARSKSLQRQGMDASTDLLGLLPKNLHQGQTLEGTQLDADANLRVAITEEGRYNLIKKAMNDKDFINAHEVSEDVSNRILKQLGNKYEQNILEGDAGSLINSYTVQAAQYYNQHTSNAAFLNSINIDTSKSNIAGGIFSSGSRKAMHILGMYDNYSRTQPYTRHTFSPADNRSMRFGNIITSRNTEERMTRKILGRNYTLGDISATLEASSANVINIIENRYDKIVAGFGSVNNNIKKHGALIADELARIVSTTADFSNVDSRYIESKYGQIAMTSKNITASKDIVTPLLEEDLTSKNIRGYQKARSAMGTVKMDKNGVLKYHAGDAQYVRAGEETLLLQGYGTVEDLRMYDDSMLHYTVNASNSNMTLNEQQINNLIMDNMDKFKVGESLMDDEAHNMRILHQIFEQNGLSVGFRLDSIKQKDVMKMSENFTEKGATRSNLTAIGRFNKNITGFLKEIGREDLVGGAALTDVGFRGVIEDARSSNVNIDKALKRYGFNSIEHLISESNLEKHTMSEAMYDIVLNGEVTGISNFDYSKHKNYGGMVNKHLATMEEVLRGSDAKMNGDNATFKIADLIKKHNLIKSNVNVISEVKNGQIFLNDNIRLDESSLNMGAIHSMYQEIQKLTGIQLIHNVEGKNVYGIGQMVNNKLVGVTTYNYKNLLLEQDVYNTSHNRASQILNEISTTKKQLAHYTKQAKKYSQQIAHYKKANDIENLNLARNLYDKIKTKETLLRGDLSRKNKLASEIVSSSKTIKITDQVIDAMKSNKQVYSEARIQEVMKAYNEQFDIKTGNQFYQNINAILSNNEYIPTRDKSSFVPFLEGLYREKHMRPGDREYSAQLIRDKYNRSEIATVDKVVAGHNRAYNALVSKANNTYNINNLTISERAVKEEWQRQSLEMANDFNQGKITKVEDLMNDFDIIDINDFTDNFSLDNKNIETLTNKNIIIKMGEEFAEDARYVAIPGIGSHAGDLEVRNNALKQVTALQRMSIRYLKDPSHQQRQMIDESLNNMRSSVKSMVKSKNGLIKRAENVEITALVSRQKATAINNITDASKSVEANIAKKSSVIKDQFMRTAKINNQTLEELEAAGMNYDYAGISKEAFRKMGYFDEEVMKQFGAANEDEMVEILKTKGIRAVLYRDPVVYRTSFNQAQIFLDESISGEGINAAAHTMLKMYGDFDGDNLNIGALDLTDLDRNGKLRKFSYGEYMQLKEHDKNKAVLEHKLRQMNMNMTTYKNFKALDQDFSLESISLEQALFKRDTINAMMKENKIMLSQGEMIQKGENVAANLSRQLGHKDIQNIKAELSKTVASLKEKGVLSSELGKGAFSTTAQVQAVLDAHSDKMSEGEIDAFKKYHNVLRYQEELATKSASSGIGTVNYANKAFVKTANRLASQSSDDILIQRSNIFSKSLTQVEQELLQAKKKQFVEADTRIVTYNEAMSKARSHDLALVDRHDAISSVEQMLDYDDSIIDASKFTKIYDENADYFARTKRSLRGVATEDIERHKYNAVKNDMLGYMRNLVNEKDALKDTVTAMKDNKEMLLRDSSATLEKAMNLEVLDNASYKANEALALSSESMVDKMATGMINKASNMLSRQNGRGIAVAALGMAAGLGVLAAAGRPLHKGGAQAEDNHQSPVPNFSDSAPVQATPSATNGYIINMRVDSNKSRKALRHALSAGMMQASVGGQSINMQIRETRRDKPLSDKDIQQYISKYM